MTSLSDCHDDWKLHVFGSSAEAPSHYRDSLERDLEWALFSPDIKMSPHASPVTSCDWMLYIYCRQYSFEVAHTWWHHSNDVKIKRENDCSVRLIHSWQARDRHALLSIHKIVSTEAHHDRQDGARTTDIVSMHCSFLSGIFTLRQFVYITSLLRNQKESKDTNKRYDGSISCCLPGKQTAQDDWHTHSVSVGFSSRFPALWNNHKMNKILRLWSSRSWNVAPLFHTQAQTQMHEDIFH